MLIVLTCVTFNVTRAGPVVNLVRYFTNWSLLATYFTVIFGLIIGSNPSWDTNKAVNLHALHHLMYTLTMFMNPVVVLMYWGLIHQDHLNEIRTLYKGDDRLIGIKIWHTYIVHSIPSICAIIIFRMSTTVLVRRHYQVLIVFGSIYTYTNYTAVLARDGRPLYWFLTWKDPIWETIAIAAAINITFCLLFYSTALFDEYVSEMTSLKNSFN